MVAVSALATLTATSPSALAAARTPPATPSASPGVENPGHLDLGPADVLETRTISTPQPGVTLTQITRGTTDYALTWTVETLIPATGTSPHPGAPPPGLSDQASAGAEADRLVAKGYPARVEVVEQPQGDRKSTRLKSSNANTSYAVFCL